MTHKQVPLVFTSGDGTRKPIGKATVFEDSSGLHFTFKFDPGILHMGYLEVEDTETYLLDQIDSLECMPFKCAINAKVDEDIR